MDESVTENNLSINNSNTHDTVNNENIVAEENHQNITKRNKRNITRGQMKRKKKVKPYCSICGKYFSTPGTFRYHMKTYHDNKTNELSTWKHLYLAHSKDNDLILQKHDKTAKPNVSLPEVASETSDTVNDNIQYKCSICDCVSKSHAKLLLHENLHDQHDQQLNVNSDDQDQQYQNEEPVESFQDIPGTSRGEIDEMACSQCACKFHSIDTYRLHLSDCNKMKKNPSEFENKPVEPIKLSEPVKDVDVNMPVIKKIVGVLDKDHLQKLKSLTIVARSFECDFCNTTCDRIDHMEYQNWWTPIDTDDFLCYVCFEKFSDIETFQKHESEHVINNGC